MKEGNQSLADIVLIGILIFSLVIINICIGIVMYLRIKKELNNK